MAELISLVPGGDASRIRAGATIAPLNEDQARRHAPDLMLALVEPDGRLLARASCWWNQTPALPGERVGLIGHFAAEDDDSAARIIVEAVNRLGEHGCTVAVGPMDGNTWRSYRFVVERGVEPPFFLEPTNPPWWPEQFTRAGFTVLAIYTSALANDLTVSDSRLPGAEARLHDAGVVVRTLRMERADDELRRIFALSLESFARNFLYTPLSEDEFLEQNRRLLPYVHPDLVLLAEHGDELAGFLFAVPNLLSPSSPSTDASTAAGRPDAMIIKTVAVSRASEHAGLGSLLVGMAHRNARALGFTRAIHALMHESNVSRNISGRYAKTMRRYALFVRPLGIRREHR